MNNDNNILQISKYKNAFGELGTLPGVHHITVDETVPLVVHAARKVPHAIKDKPKDELDHMVKLRVIVPVDEPTKWGSSLVIIEKPDKRVEYA